MKTSQEFFDVQKSRHCFHLIIHQYEAFCKSVLYIINGLQFIRKIIHNS